MVETAALLAALCGPGSLGLAPHLNHAAHVHHVRRALLAGLIRTESHCDPLAIGAKGELGAGQIKPGTWAAGTYTREQLLTPRYNLLATARHLRRLINLCGGSELHALYVYSGRRYYRDYGTDKRTGKDYARTVLRFAPHAAGPERDVRAQGAKAMSKKNRGTTRDANRRRERHQRSERERQARRSLFDYERGPGWRFSPTTPGIQRLLRDLLGIKDVSVEESRGLGPAIIRLRGPRGNGCQAHKVQSARSLLVPLKPAGVQWVITGARR